MTTLIKCAKCKEEKKPSEFHNSYHKKNGLTSSCKICNRAAANLYRENNLDQEKFRARRKVAGQKYRRKYEKSIRGTGITGHEKAIQVLRWMEANPWRTLNDASLATGGFNRYIWCGIRHLFEIDNQLELREAKYKRNDEPEVILLKRSEREVMQKESKLKKEEAAKKKEERVEYTKDDGLSLVQQIMQMGTRGIRTTWRFIKNEKV